MKKSLVALAVLGAFAVSAQAQTQVSISGLIDMGYQSLNPEGANNNTSGIDGNGSSTSTLVFSGTEDLGGGLKAGFFLQTNFHAGDTGTNMFDAQNYISLAGSFGEVKLGNVNSQLMAAATTAQPFGTAIGGAYDAQFSRLNGVQVAGSTSTAPAGPGLARVIRSSNSLYYTSPNMGGFQATVGHKFENDDAGGTTAYGMTELAVGYRAAGLNVLLAHHRATAGAGGFGGLAADATVTQTLLGANYTFGPATVYGGFGVSDSNAAGGNIDATNYNLGVKYAVTPALAVMANFTNVNDKTAANIDRRLVGLGADYSLSKRTVAYVRYQNGDRNRAVDGVGKFNNYAVGVRHSF